VIAARRITKTGSGFLKNPIYVLLLACHSLVRDDRFKTSTR
jgi:hypothetical protein